MFNKSVLITGCDSGIGFSLCKRLIERGFYIISTCKTELGKQKVENLFADFKNKQNNLSVDELRDRKESQHTSTEDVGLVTVLDITSEHSVRKLVSTYSELNKIDKIPNLYSIINNAGIWRFSTIQESCLNEDNIHEELERWKSVINTNLLGTVSITLYFIKFLRPYEGYRPRIIFISSILDECVIPAQCSYISSKFAIRGFHESLLHELSDKNIYLIRISPGAIKNTNLFSDLEDYTVDKSYKLKQTKSIKDSLRKLMKLGSNVNGAVSTVICALESKKPKIYYKKTSGTFIFRIAKLLPRFLYIKIVNFILNNDQILDYKLVKIPLGLILK